MAEYIERTEELILAVNAGARVIENTKRYHGASYCIDVFAADHKEIPYLKAAEVLRGFDEIPAVDVVPVVRCKECKYSVEIGSYGCYCRKEDSPWFNDTFEVYMDVDDFCSYGERKEADGNG